MTEHSSNESDKHARYGTFTGTVSLIHHMLALIDLGNEKFNEFYNFDRTTMTLFIRFGREMARLEVWCQSMGLERNVDGTFRKGRDTPLPSDVTTRLQNAPAIRLSLAELSELLKKILHSFTRIVDGSPAEMEANLENIQSTSPHRHVSSFDPEIAAEYNTETMEQVYTRLRESGLGTQNRTTADKVMDIARKIHPSLRLWLDEFSDLNVFLQSFTMAQKVEFLAQSVPHRLLRVGFQSVEDGMSDIQQQLQQLQRLTESRLRSVYEASQGVDNRTQVSAFRNLLALKQFNLMDIPGQRGQIEIGGQEIEYIKSLASGENIHSEENQSEEDSLTDCSSPSRQEDPLGENSSDQPKRRIVVYREGYTLLEWNLDIRAETEDQVQIERRLGHLVASLRIEAPDELHLLRALGYAVETPNGVQQYGIVYQLPQQFQNKIPGIVSLREAMMELTPSLGQRFHLAESLAKAFHNFQTSQWLHQGISSDNIIFFRTEGQALSLDQPYIVGFDFARHTSDLSAKYMDEVLEKDFYKHPLRRKIGQNNKAAARYRGEFDIYSIGRVLLDIAFWQVRSHMDPAEPVADLPWLVGELYTQTVSWCLGLVEESPMRNDIILRAPPSLDGIGAWSSQLIMGFEDQVLMRLGKCRV